MNIRKPVAFVKADISTIDFLKLKPYKLVSVWFKNELFNMTMVDSSPSSEMSINSISNVSSLPVFFIDANGLVTIYQESKLTIKGKIIELTSIEASQKDFFIKDLTTEKYYGVLS